MTSLIDEPQILKTDRRGRVWVPKERREALLAEFAGSGVSAAEFARLAGLKYATFIGWVAKARRVGVPAGESGSASTACTAAPLEARVSRAPVRLFEAMVEAPPMVVVASRPLLVEAAGGARLQVAEPAHVAWAAELLLLLGQRGGRPC